MSCPVCQLPVAEAVLDRACPFCSAVFSRADGARRHAKSCPQRGDRDLQARRRGRKALSCDNCSRIKIHCNAQTRTPCEGCISRKVACTFSRCCIDPSHRRSVDKTPSALPNQNEDRLTLSFLLNSTDDKQDFVTERTVGAEPDGVLLGPICATPSQPRTPMGDIPGSFIDPMLLLPFDSHSDLLPIQLDELYNASGEGLLGPFLDSSPHEDRLSERIRLLELELEACFQDAFDHTAFQRFFNASNVYAFAATFCRKRHYQYPIIHWPTFALEQVCLPLLLVVALTGATYSYRTGDEADHIKRARSFYQLADAYIFDRLDKYFQCPPPNIDATETIQLCQAALLMYGLDSLMAGDAATKHISLTKRLPALVSALRRLNLMACRHEASEDWQLFIQREHIIRLVTWTFCSDCLATLCCNNPPLFSMLEMTGDLPCGPQKWDADSAIEFEKLRTQTPLSYSLQGLVEIFLDEVRRSSTDLAKVPIFHLHVLMCAFQPLIYNLHVSMALASQSTNLLETLRIWRGLWHKAMGQIPDDDRNCLGVARYIPGIEYLSRSIIEVAISPKAGEARYLRRIPSYGTKEIHEFIREFVAGS